MNFSAKYPFAYGDFKTRDDELPRSLGFVCDARVLSDPSILAAMKATFQSFSRLAGCFYASAKILRNCVWVQNTIGYGPEAEGPGPKFSYDTLNGLSYYPSWWTWTGPEYADVIAPQQASEGTRFGEFTFYESGPKPMNRDQVQAGLVDPGKPWVPAEYLMKVSHEDNIQGPADVIPESLR